ncbi:MAG: zeta toxin family protein [Deltaproteobacteria bacterium]|nr:zeta toxin family protein [Deltaproteobacteria bacterium]MBW2417018.1 zeta toxin family protein [Deltaproteobacteria bacterium]
MADVEQQKARASGGGEKGRVWIEEEGGRRPFMRGIMVHSLMARGVAFEDALATADEIRVRIRGRGVVPRAELAKAVEEILGSEALGEHQPPIPLPPSIKVGSPDDCSPFSKGALSQSLLAASIEPNDAFDVSRELELELLRKGTQRIARRDLRMGAYHKLLQRFGPKTAARYLVWRKFQEPEKPVIILLGGASGAGKTSLALEVARRLGISRVLSTDAIRQVMRIMLSPELIPAIHASSFEAHQALATPAGVVDGDEDPVVQGFMAQASVVSVGVRAMIDRAIEENASLVLDGVTLVPGLIDLERYADVAHVIYLVVARLDEESLRSHFLKRGRRQSRRDGDRYVEHLESILKIQNHFMELADLYEVPIVDNITVDGSVLLVMRHVVETLRKAGFDESEFL